MLGKVIRLRLWRAAQLGQDHGAAQGRRLANGTVAAIAAGVGGAVKGAGCGALISAGVVVWLLVVCGMPVTELRALLRWKELAPLFSLLGVYAAVGVFCVWGEMVRGWLCRK